MSSVKKRILVLRYRFIGDTILTVPFLRNLRRAEPDAYIAWVVAPGSTEVVSGIPYVDEFIYWDPATMHADCRGEHRNLSAKYAFVKQLRSRKFDKVYVLKRSMSSALLAWFSGAAERVGFNTEGRGLLLTKTVSYRHDQHEVNNFLDVLRVDGVPVTDDYLEAWLNEEEKRFAADFFLQNGIGETETVIGLHPFAANQARAWHEDNFIEAANALQSRYGARIIIFGGSRDAELGKYMQDNISPRPVLAVGTTTLRQTMAVLARCNLLLCNDSGIMHLGAALNIPLVALFGPQSPVKFAPWGKKCRVLYSAFPCSPCRQKFFQECNPSARSKPQCVEAISVREVLDTIDKFGGGMTRRQTGGAA